MNEQKQTAVAGPVEPTVMQHTPGPWKAVSAVELENETPGQRIEREAYERAISRKESALQVLGPLGFEDAEDGEVPGAIWHRGASILLDCAKLKPQEVVHELLLIGMERGVAALRRDLRAAIGL